MSDEQEYKVASIPIDEGFPAAVEALTKDGWDIIPNIKPMAVYHLFRNKKAPTVEAKAQLSIDDTKVGILGADGVMR